MAGIAQVAASVPVQGALDLVSARALVGRERVNALALDGPESVIGQGASDRLNFPHYLDSANDRAADVREAGSVPVAGDPALANAPAQAAQESPTGPPGPLSVPIVMNDETACVIDLQSAPVSCLLAAIAGMTDAINGKIGTTGITPIMAIGTMVTGTEIGNQEVIGTIGGITTRR